MPAIVIHPGNSTSLGTKIQPNGVNFCLFARSEISIQLLIYKENTSSPLSFFLHKTGNFHHILLENLIPPFGYCYKTEDYNFPLLDPYATWVDQGLCWVHPSDFLTKKSIPRPLYRKEELVIYEMHLRGFTQDPSSKVQAPGTFLGMIEKIDHLKDLGINAVELLPIFTFDPQEKPFGQYWGYSTIGFFSPAAHYGTPDQFLQLVTALHEAKIQVILDVVYNHTAEQGSDGAVYNFKAFAPDHYYLFTPSGAYFNASGCGNTFACNTPITMELVLASMHFWAEKMEVDGFRFDLASTFYYGKHGEKLLNSSILDAIAQDPLLSSLHLIAEPWDAHGLYQVGNFYPGTLFSEWNGRYRDTVRRFLRGESNRKGRCAMRLTGSEDIYSHEGGTPSKSINFVTAHDGFTLTDLVSYDNKHNWANGEQNQDGSNHNFSWNCGEEGVTENPAILALRERQKRNFHLALMVSLGVPMVLMGDEYGHTRQGNNNAWCQDNRLNWFLWDSLEKERAFYRFFKGLIHWRKGASFWKANRFLTAQDIQWHGKEPFTPHWEGDDGILAFTLDNFYVAFNAQKSSTTLLLPPSANGPWHLVAYTGALPPNDFRDPGTRPAIDTPTVWLLDHSAILLEAL